MVGADLSIRTVTTCADSRLPALSTLQNAKEWTPSVVNVTAVPLCVAPPSTMKCVWATPDRLSIAESETDRSELVYALGIALAVVTGAVRSTFTGALDAVLALPARSDTVPASCCAAPSVVIEPSAGQVAVSMPDSASVHVQ